MIAPQKNSAISGAGIPNSRNARQQVDAGMSRRSMETALRAVSSHTGRRHISGRGAASLVSYSRRWPQLPFDTNCLPACRVAASVRKLGERVLTIRSPFSLELIQIVVAIRGALAERIFNVSPSSTYLDAVPSAMKFGGLQCPTL